MILSHAIPRIASAEAKQRVEAILAAGCKSEGCEHASASLTRRIVSGNVVLYLQCQGCGRSLGGALSRNAVPSWQSLPAWNVDLERERHAVWEARAAQYQAEAEARAAALEAERERKAELRATYLDWCRTSPEWHHLSGRVMWRSRGVCEACLEAKAETVHHLTYDQGRLPPAWSLKAVCRACHDRLHADRLGVDDEWCSC